MDNSPFNALTAFIIAGSGAGICVVLGLIVVCRSTVKAIDSSIQDYNTRNGNSTSTPGTDPISTTPTSLPDPHTPTCQSDVRQHSKSSIEIREECVDLYLVPPTPVGWSSTDYFTILPPQTEENTVDISPFKDAPPPYLKLFENLEK